MFDQARKRVVGFVVTVSLAGTVLYSFPIVISGGIDAGWMSFVRGYVDWWISALRGDFLTPKVSQSIPWTLSLMGLSTAVAFIAGTIAGALLESPLGRFGWFAKSGSSVFLVLYATPFFVFGMVLIWVFVWMLGWFPNGGGYTLGESPALSLAAIRTLLWHGTLPFSSIIITGIAQWLILMRAMMITTNGEDYVAFSRAMGLKSWRILSWYRMRNCALPQVTQLFMSLGIILTGAVVVEIVFAYPGIGYVLQQAIIGNDQETVRSVVITTSLIFAALLAIMDMLYPVIDRRISRN